MTLGDLVQAVGGELVSAERGVERSKIRGLCGIEDVEPGYVTYAENENWLKAAVASAPLAVIAKPGLDRPGGHTYIIHENPEAAYATGVHCYVLAEGRLTHPEPAIAGTAQIDPTAKVATSVRIGHFVVVESDTSIGERAELRAGSRVGKRVVIGDECWIGENAVICDNTELESGVRVLPGAVVGSGGFSYARDLQGVPRANRHMGRVVIRAHAEIGANTVVARAEGEQKETEIGDHAKVDSLVQIAHNCKVGARCTIAAQTGLAGRVVLEDDVTLLGQVGVKQRTKVGRGALVGGQAGVWGNLEGGRHYSGYPAEPHGRSIAKLVVLGKLYHAFLGKKLSCLRRSPTER